jgi:hypothetical membrane protein
MPTLEPSRTTLTPRTILTPRTTLTPAVAAGLVAVAGYVATTVMGAAVTGGYSHVADPISELTSSHAPHRVALASAYVAYNLAMAVFGISLRRLAPGSRLLAAGAWLTVVGTVAGIAQVTVFPQDTLGTPATTAGAVHIGLAATSALLTVVSTIVYGLAFRRDVHWPRLASFSFACTGLIVTTGPLAAASVDTGWMGAAERLPIGTFLVWVAVVALAVRRLPRTSR